MLQSIGTSDWNIPFDSLIGQFDTVLREFLQECSKTKYGRYFR